MTKWYLIIYKMDGSFHLHSKINEPRIVQELAIQNQTFYKQFRMSRVIEIQDFWIEEICNKEKNSYISI